MIIEWIGWDKDQPNKPTNKCRTSKTDPVMSNGFCYGGGGESCLRNKNLLQKINWEKEDQGAQSL